MSEIHDRLRKVFGSFREVQATHKIEVQATHFKNTTNIYLPRTPFDKLQSGMQLIRDARQLRKLTKEAKRNEVDVQRATRRSIQKGKHIIRCNTFEWFVTFTFATDRYDVEKCLQRMEDWLKN